MTRCAICRCEATTSVFGFRVCAHHAVHGEDGPVCQTCQHPQALSGLAAEIAAAEAAAAPLAEAPFALTPKPDRRSGFQKELF